MYVEYSKQNWNIQYSNNPHSLDYKNHHWNILILAFYQSLYGSSWIHRFYYISIDAFLPATSVVNRDVTNEKTSYTKLDPSFSIHSSKTYSTLSSQS